MEPVRALTDVPALPVLAVIINCGTKWVTSLALASTLRHAGYPALVIDCASSDGSREHFRKLAASQRWDFYWLQWPLRAHGIALDEIFRSVKAESLLLVDSDAELLSNRPIRAMAGHMHDDRHAYGAGFLQKAQWLGSAHGLPAGVGWYEERMWIPLVRLRTEAIRAALGAGESFLQRRHFVELPAHPMLSRTIGLRFWLPGLRMLGRRKRVPGNPDSATAPAFVEYDTGARIHRRLRLDGHRYCAIDENLWSDVDHQHGVTRAHLASALRRMMRVSHVLRTDNATLEESAAGRARGRLAEHYNVADARR